MLNYQESTAEKLERLVKITVERGVCDACLMDSSNIIIEPELAQRCKTPRCENYGLSASCPPHVKGPDEFLKLCSARKYAIFVAINVPTSSLFSSEQTGIMGLLHEEVSHIRDQAMEMGVQRARAFAGGSCKKIFCNDHLYCRVVSENLSCRHPEFAVESMSGYGINVSRLAETAGWKVLTDSWGSPDNPMSSIYGLILL